MAQLLQQKPMGHPLRLAFPDSHAQEENTDHDNKPMMPQRQRNRQKLQCLRTLRVVGSCGCDDEISRPGNLRDGRTASAGGKLPVSRRIHRTRFHYHPSQESLDMLRLFHEHFGILHQGVWMLRQFMDL
ncbi:MAG: hypothetical protein KJ857_02040, partial [Proteobacteria bacterium]|nr:hypothetical protein [Pseudomonadota bacterium]